MSCIADRDRSVLWRNGCVLFAAPALLLIRPGFLTPLMWAVRRWKTVLVHIEYEVAGMSNPSPFESLQMPSALACKFFAVFSRFEYALKRQKYVRANRNDAQVAWKSFAKEHVLKFDADHDTKLQRAVDYLKKAPPKKQIHRDRVLDWAEPQQFSGGDLLPWVLDQVQIIRNNLFHGGKFPSFPVSDPSRDRELIESALIILEHALKLNSDIERSFWEGLDL